MKSRVLQVLVLLSASAVARAEYQANPNAFLAQAGLTDAERQLMLTGDRDAIRASVGDTQGATQQIQCALSINTPFT